MSSKEEWCADKLSKLLNEDLRISTLTEIKEHFQEISNSEAVQTAELLQLPLVFDCLNDSNKEQVDLACEVLSLCMEKLDIAETTTRYSIPLERALSHPNPGVKLMALIELSRILKCETSKRNHIIVDLSKHSIFNKVVRCVGDDDLRVASTACTIITNFAAVSLDCIIKEDAIKIIKEVMAINEVVRLRFYEVFIDICIFEREAHNKIVAAGFLSPMIHEINSSDILLRLNIIEMLYRLVEHEYGYEYLESEGFMNKLFKQFIEDNDPIFLQLCEPGILKFFGHMAHCKPNEVFNKYPQVVDHIFSNLESSDYTVLKVSLETISYISTADKSILDSYVGNKMNRAIQTMFNRISSFPTKEKIQTLLWLEELLGNPTNENSSSIACKWFQALGDNPLDIVMHYARNPFEEIRLAGLGVLASTSEHKWGQEYIKKYPGLMEFLLDRTAETSKSAKDIKFTIVSNLHDKNFGIFTHSSMLQFSSFIKEGAHFVHAVTEVAIEGE